MFYYLFPEKKANQVKHFWHTNYLDSYFSVNNCIYFSKNHVNNFRLPKERRFRTFFESELLLCHVYRPYIVVYNRKRKKKDVDRCDCRSPTSYTRRHKSTMVSKEAVSGSRRASERTGRRFGECTSEQQQPVWQKVQACSLAVGVP